MEPDWLVPHNLAKYTAADIIHTLVTKFSTTVNYLNKIIFTQYLINLSMIKFVLWLHKTLIWQNKCNIPCIAKQPMIFKLTEFAFYIFLPVFFYLFLLPVVSPILQCILVSEIKQKYSVHIIELTYSWNIWVRLIFSKLGSH